MKTIHFRNTEKWQDVYVTVYNRDESVSEVTKLENQDIDGDFVLEIDDDKYDHVEFVGTMGKKTSKIYPGALSIGVEYKQNDKMDKNLTYLFAKGIESTGRVDNYVLEDAINLPYREDKCKKISVFVPKSYDGVTPHDILYFFDAQNLFCGAGDYTENGDPYGSWQLDVVLSEVNRQFGKNIIVVGIDNADEYRSHELFMNPEKFGALSPLATAIPDDDFSKGYLDGLSSFMVDTLHSFIKANYCIKEDYIGNGGSSMGGIASFYCGLSNMGFYKYALSYSPAYGLYEMSAFENYFVSRNFTENIEKLPKIHIYCGIGDPLEEELLPSSKNMKKTLIKYGYPEENIFETYDNEKPHNEESWRLILHQSFSNLLK